MTKLFIANFCTAAAFEAERDDPSARDMGLSDFAAPQFACVSADEGQALLVAQGALTAEIDELHEGEDENPLEGAEWQNSPWQEQPTVQVGEFRMPVSPTGRRFRELILADAEGEPLGAVVIQEVEAV